MAASGFIKNTALDLSMTAPDSGCPYTGYPGSIFMKSSPMDSISFPLGRGTPVIRDASSPNLNNAAATNWAVLALAPAAR